eukprot:2405131-Heterocapsa_arctica.AAC.1
MVTPHSMLAKRMVRAQHVRGFNTQRAKHTLMQLDDQTPHKLTHLIQLRSGEQRRKRFSLAVGRMLQIRPEPLTPQPSHNVETAQGQERAEQKG